MIFQYIKGWVINKMNIWLMHPTAGGPEIGRHWRAFYMAREWGKQGHRVNIIASNYHHLMLNQGKFSGFTKIEGIDYYFVPVKKYHGNGLGRLKNMLDYALNFRKLAHVDLDKLGKPDVIIASIPHLFHVFVARRLAKFFGAKFVVEIRDIWPESICEMGQASKFHPFVWLNYALSKYCYKRLDYCVSLLSNSEDYLIANGMGKGKFIWIPNGFAMHEETKMAVAASAPTKAFDDIKKLKLKNAKIIAYTGGMGPPNALEALIKVAKKLYDIDENIHFFLIGNGIEKAKLTQDALDFPNIHFYDEINKIQAEEFITLVDCAVINMLPLNIYRMGISLNKLFEYAYRAPRTIIATMPEAMIGLEELPIWRCDANNPDQILTTILIALKSPINAPINNEVAYFFSYQYLAKKYLTMLEKLVN